MAGKDGGMRFAGRPTLAKFSFDKAEDKFCFYR